MESLIEKFLRVCDGYGYGSSSGSGYGRGSGYGSGSSSGYGDGDGSGYGSGSSSGYGDGDGSGSGYGDGSGSGYGDGRGLISFNGDRVYYIDGIPTVIKRVRDNLAIGYVVNSDLTTNDCYVVKHENIFAHGKTLIDARDALRNKIFESMDVDEKIDIFLKEFCLGVPYPAKMFYEWHNKLTGSCEFGRDKFVKDHGINIETDVMTVEKFIELTENDYGKEIILQIKERIEHD